jgi:hypothetical protein
MHRLEHRTYAGAPGETVTVDTEVEGGGAVTVFVDGDKTEEDPIFTLKATAGAETQMQISLIGAEGESCVVHISQVDGGSDPDLLLCQRLDPAPIHQYRFIVTAANAIAALARAARPRLAAGPELSRRAAPKPSSMKKTRTRKASTKKTGAKKTSRRKK